MSQNTQTKVIEVHETDLPLQCPTLDTVKWNSHPRVFLQIKKSPNQEITCPYCSTHYKLVK